MRKKNASATIYMIFFLVIFLAFCAFAVDGTIVLTNRAKLQSVTEATAVAAASQFNYSQEATVDQVKQTVENAAKATFALLRIDSLKTATIGVEVNVGLHQVRVSTQYMSQPYFLAFLGVTGINLQAKACAVSEIRPVTANYSGINWVTANAVYESDILSKDKNLNDTAILLPLGNFASSSYDKLTGFTIFDALASGDSSKSLSLGPGGFITIKLPVPIVDKPGKDLYIVEAGDAAEGYMVFAGIDKDPANPYVQSDKPGGGISWVNISRTGSPILDTDNEYSAAYTELGVSTQKKFYGSGYFDIGLSSSGGFPGISVVKYIRIIDDNDEGAFVNGYHVNLYGEASTATAGADIDSVTVLNHVRLMAPRDYKAP